MREYLTPIIVLVIVAALAWTGGAKFNPRTIDRTFTDTVYVDVPYEVEVIKEVEKPVQVTIFKTEYDTVRSVEVRYDTLIVEVDNDSLLFNTKFLTNFPDRPKFLGLDYNGKYVTFTGLTITGETNQVKWDVEERNFTIGSDGGNWVALESSRRKRKFFTQSIGAGYIWTATEETPYFVYKPRVRLIGLNLEGGLYLSQDPFVTAGVVFDLK